MRSSKRHLAAAVYARISACFLSLMLLVSIGNSLPQNHFSTPTVGATSYTTPLEAPNYSVLYVSCYYGPLYALGWIVSDLSAIGFNVTWVRNQTIDYTNDWRTSDLSQYDIVIVHRGFSTTPPVQVTDGNLTHFTNYDGILVVIGDSLFGDADGWRAFDGSDTQQLEARLGIDYIGWANGVIGEYADNGTYTLTNSSIQGLPSTITQSCSTYSLDWMTISASLNGASQIYSFTDEESQGTIVGITYYKNATGAIGIWVSSNIAYIKEVGGTKYLFGMADGLDGNPVKQKVSERRAFLKSILAYTLERDYSTILKFQPLAIWRKDDFGSTSWSDSQHVTAFNNLDGNVSLYDMPYSFSFFGTQASARPQISALCVAHEHIYDCNKHIHGADIVGNTVAENQQMIDNEDSNRNALGFKDLGLTASADGTLQVWDANWLIALYNKGITVWLLTECDDRDLGVRAKDQWWEISINRGVILHDTRYFRGGSDTWASAWFAYYCKRGEALISANKHFVDLHLGHTDEWSTSDKGRKAFLTDYWNLTYELPEIKFVTLREATICTPAKYDGYFTNVSKSDDTISFTLNADNVQSVATVGKGTAWIRINSTQTIASVMVDGSAIYSFDSYSLKIPAKSCDVTLVLGEPSKSTPRLVDSEGAKIGKASFSNDTMMLQFISRNNTLSTAEVYCGNRGEPMEIYVVNGTLTWSYDASTTTLAFNVTHKSPTRILIYWKLPSDVNNDGIVDIADLALMGETYGTTPSGANWDEGCDINGDEIIDTHDLEVCSRNYGKNT